MSVAPVRSPSSALPRPRTGSSALRLALRPTASGASPSGALDGAWWPYSTDLLVELPSLVAVLDVAWGRITRVDVNPRFWQALPREVPVPGHVVKVACFTTEQDPHKPLLLSCRPGRWELLVVPPQTGQAAAARLMAAAADPTGSSTARALIAAERAHLESSGADGAAGDMGPEATRESEGGVEASLPWITPADRTYISVRGRER